MQKIKDIFLHSSGRYIASAIISVIVTFLYLLSYGFDTFLNYCNGLSIGGAVTFLIGGLVMVSYLGGFDTITYGFSTIKKDGKGKYLDLYDYSTKKKEERKTKKLPFIPYFTVGGIVIIISFILSLLK